MSTATPSPSPPSATDDWTCKRLLDWTTAYFEKSGLDQGRLCSELLLAGVLDFSRIQLYTHFDHCPDPEQLAQFRGLIKRAAAGEPVQYLTGKCGFYSLELSVSPAVLIPRSDTELLAGEAIKRAGTFNNASLCVLDMCTGSGCVAIAVGRHVPQATVWATDICEKALAVAQTNRDQHDLTDRIEMACGDLFDAVEPGAGPFHVITVNPPYISPEVYADLETMVREYEPVHALLAEENGLIFYRRLLEQVQDHLVDGGFFLVEIAWDQGPAVLEMFQNSGLSDCEILKDTVGHDRVIVGRRVCSA